MHHVANTSDHLTGDGDAFFTGAVGVVDAAHALHEFVRDRDAELVDHDLGVAEAGQRPDATDDRYVGVLDALQELIEQIEVEHGLGDDVLGTGFDLPIEAAKLLVHVERAGVGADAD